MSSNSRRHVPFRFRPTWALFALLLCLGVFTVPAMSRAFTEPKGSPRTYVPDANGQPEIFPFLNASSVGQTKLGSLLIGSTGLGSHLCLNADPSLGANDSNNCIAAWSDLSGRLNGSFLHLLSSSNGTLDRGYTNTQGNVSNGQLVSLLAQPNNGSASGSIYADGKADTDYAGVFAGTLFIGNSTGTAQLCLNDVSPGTGTCIQHWADVASIVFPNLIKLQNVTGYSVHVADQGSAGATGPLSSGSIVIGIPGDGTPTATTCGDGLCSINTENRTSCPSDCP